MDISNVFSRYIAQLSERLGHADRHAGLSGYCTALMLQLSRKSVEPMAARIDPLHASSRHQALHHFVAKSEWSDAALMAGVREWVQPLLATHSGCYWIVDDTGFPKKGRHSVGVARQYCGQLGKQENCQVAVSLSLASLQGSLPIAYQLYLPKAWLRMQSGARRRECHRILRSPPSPRWPWHRCAKPLLRACPRVWCWPTLLMAMKRIFEMGSRNWACGTRWAFAHSPRCGRQGLRRCRLKLGQVVAFDPPSCVVRAAMSR